MTLRRFHCGRLVHAFEISKLRMVSDGKRYVKCVVMFLVMLFTREARKGRNLKEYYFQVCLKVS